MQAIVDEVTVFPLLILFLLADDDDENGLAILRSARILKVGREVPCEVERTSGGIREDGRWCGAYLPR